MPEYEIRLNQLGKITMLPDSQRLFGFLIHLSKYQGEERIEAFVKGILEGTQVCMVSNIFPLGYYPLPKDYLMKRLESRLGNNAKKVKELEQEQKEIREKLEDPESFKASMEKYKQEFCKKAQEIRELSKKEIYSAIKKMDFIEKEDFLKLLSESKEGTIKVSELEDYDFITKDQLFIQKFYLESQTKRLPGLPNRAYSLPILSLKRRGSKIENSLEKEQGEEGVLRRDPKKSVKDFCFLVRAETESLFATTLEKMREEVKDSSYPCFLGGKGSSGYNEYEIVSIVKKEAEFLKDEDFSLRRTKKKRYLNLGMLLPKENALDWEGSMPDIHTSDRKPYEINDEKSKVISFIAPGSLIESKEKSPYKIGKSIKNPYNPLYKNAIIFGNSFLKEVEESDE